MEATFNDKQVPPTQDEQRRLDNAVRAEKGEQQVGGEAGRQQVGSTDPSGMFPVMIDVFVPHMLTVHLSIHRV